MEGRLIAVNDVELKARNGTEEQLRWFYGELIGLRPVDVPDDGGSPALCFRSDRITLRIDFFESPEVESVDFRLHCAVPSLDTAAQELRERKYPFEESRGVSGTDRALTLLDPAGHRVEIRKLWPTAMV
jgi:hypothetical protein